MWRVCMALTEAEAVFRCLKPELGLRPVFHQKAEPDAEMAALFEAMGIPLPPRRLRKTVV